MTERGASRYGLSGRVAVVTGGAGVIGRAIVSRLRAEGVRVASWDLRPVPGDMHAFDVDVTKPRSVEVGVRLTREALGPVDIIVNNAGAQGPLAEVCAISLEDWQLVVDANLTSSFVCTRSVLPGMIDRGWGRVINIASLRGKEAPAGTAAYNAAKAGVIAFTKTLGKELARTGVLASCVTPTVVEGGLSDAATEVQLAQLRSLIPMNRFCRPDEVAAMVAFLASAECSFSTGAVFDLSGGRASY